ncbi:hypothetical protein [Mangrovicoccus sp. HB161399]|uniref:hypothetical protein n=1 Tax=Mangrovicoccus sp. HB161399 TaxID=2720392 RepID=UPI001551A662|nr:hypothetical protein [Mangrovicoccus sp. HB161399]
MRACLILLVLAAPALAQDRSEWTYGDWSATFEAHDSTEDDWLTCSARTGGDGWPVLAVSVFEGDAGPPGAYPDIKLQEWAPRHYPTSMQDGVPAHFSFDTGLEAEVMPDVMITDEGLQEAHANIFSPGSLEPLRAMAAGSRLEVSTGGKPVASFSLKGFTAAYLKMMELCGFGASASLTPGLGV